MVNPRKIFKSLALVFLLGAFVFSTTGGVDAATSLGLSISTDGDLTVGGALKFENGAQNNYILKTDALGNASWDSVANVLSVTSTDSLPEGLTNLYYDDTLVDAYIDTLKGTANGLAELDGSSLVPMLNLPAGVPNGLASLDATGKIPFSQLPAIAFNDVYPVADIAARDALTPNTADVAIVQDDGLGASRSYIWSGSAWLELLTPLDLYLESSSNLADVANISAARSNLGLGTGNTPVFNNLVLSSLGTGSVLFAGAGGYLTEDNTNFYWDDANNRLGINTNSPSFALEVAGDVKVGDGSMFYVGVASGGDPVGVNGAMYYNDTTQTFRCYENGVWLDCLACIGDFSLSAIPAAVATNTIDNTNFAQEWDWSLTVADSAGMEFGESTASTATGDAAILRASTLVGSTAIPLHIKNLGNGYSFRVDDESGGTTPFIIDEEGHVNIGSDSFDPLNHESLKVEAGATSSSKVIAGYGDLNAPLYLNIRNRNAGTQAASALTATADDGDLNINHVAVGIASSGFSDPAYGIAEPHDSFLFGVGNYTGTQGGNLILGTAEPAKSIKFVTGGGLAAANEQMRISSAGYVGINTTSPGSELDVKGTVRLSGSNSGYVGFAPAADAGNTIYTLPSADGTNGQTLITDGAGILSWSDAAGGGGYWDRVGTLISPSTAGDDITTSGDIYTTAGGAMTSDGLLTASLGLDASGAAINLNANSNFDTNINTGTSTGAVTVGNASSGAVNIISSSAINLTAANSVLSSDGTDIFLQPSGTATTAKVQVGAGGLGSTTPDLLVLDLKSDISDPVGYNGAMYYNSIANKFRCYENGSWKNCVAHDGAVSTLLAAVADSTLNNANYKQNWQWSLTTADNVGMEFGESSASVATGKAAIVEASTLTGSTAMPLYVKNLGNGLSFRVDDQSGDTTPFIIDDEGRVAIGTETFDALHPETLKVEAPSGSTSHNSINAYGDTNDYLQINIKNRNAGDSASSDVVATADNGTESIYYIDMGINSSGYVNPGFSITGPNDAYLYTAGENLAIGTATLNKDIIFHTGGTLSADERMRITGAGLVGINTTSPGSELDVKGTVRLSGSNSGYVGFAPAADAGNTIYTLPSADGTNGQTLITDGAGILSWSDAAGGGGYWDRVGTLISPSTAGDDITTSGDIYTTAGGAITSDGLLTASLGLDASGAAINLNANSNFDTNINTGTSTGAVTVGNASSGAVNIISASAINLTAANSVLSSDGTDIFLQPSGTATTAKVQIGAGGLGSTTPDLLALDVKSDISDPVGYNGAMYYNSVTNKFRCYENGAWANCLGHDGYLSTLMVAISDRTLNNGDYKQNWQWSLTTADNAGMEFGESTASTATGDAAILRASTLVGSTAIPLHIKNLGNGYSFRVDDESGGTTPFIIDEEGHVNIGSDSFDPLNHESLKVEAGATSSSKVIAGYGDLNAPLYLNIRNRNAGTQAASALTATADDGDLDINHVAVGIASSGFNDPAYGIAEPHDSFLFGVGNYTGTQGGNLILGTAEPAKSIKFVTGGGLAAANEQMRISSAGYVGINTTSPGSELDVKGTVRLSGSNSGYVGFAPAADAGSTTYTLPTADGTSGQSLTTNGAGVLSWQDSSTLFQRVGTVLSPLTAGDDVTTSGDIYTTAGGAITSDGLLTASLGLDASGATINLNANSNFDTNINTGTSTGAVTVGNASSGAVNVLSSTAINLTTANSVLSSDGTDIILQPSGTATTAKVQIGAGGLGSTTPDLLGLDVKSDAGDPVGYAGAMYYNSNTNKFRCYENGAWKDCDTTGGTTTLDTAYNNGGTITTSGAVPINFLLASGDFQASGAGSVNLTPTGASSFTSSGALTFTAGASSTWSTSSGALDITSASAATWGTGSGDLTLEAAGTGTTASVQIGAGGAGSTTPDLFALDVKSTAGDPTGYNGAMYYNASSNLFRCYENGGWKDCSAASAGSGDTLQQAYNNGATITTASNVDINFLLSAGDFTASGAGSVDLTPTAASSFTSGGALTFTAGASSTWSTSVGDLALDSAANLNLGTTNAIAVNIGKTGISTVVLGNLESGNAANVGLMKISDGSSNYISLTAPSIASDYTLTLPTTDGDSGQTMASDGAGNLSWITPVVDPMTTRGDLIYRNASNVIDRLAVGTAGQVLKTDGTDVSWQSLTSTDVGLSNVTNDAQIAKTIGAAKGDLIAYTASGNPVRLPVGGVNGQILTVDSTQATGMKWSSVATSANTLDFAEFKDAMTLDGATSIQMGGLAFSIIDSGAGALTMTPGGALTLTAGAASTWSTSAGNLTVDSAANLNLGTANATAVNIGKVGISTVVLGNLESGNAANAGLIKISDGSSNSISLTSPSLASNYTLTLPTTDGNSGEVMSSDGVGNLSWITPVVDPMTTRGDLIYRNSSNVIDRLAVGTAGQVLKTDGTDVSWQSLTSTDVGLSNVTNDAQIPKSIGTAKGDIITYTASGVPVRLPLGGVDGQHLTVDSTQATGLKWTSMSTNANTLDFSEFKDAMTLDGATSIQMGGLALSIIDSGLGALSFSPGGALTLTAGAASTWSTSAGNLTVDSAANLNLGTTNATAVNVGKIGISTVVLGSLESGNAANAGLIKISDGSSNLISLAAPSIASNYTLTLPTTDGNSGQTLISDGAGNLSWITPATDPMTTRGDLIYRNASNLTDRLAVGTAGQILKTDGTDVSWQTLTSADVGLSNLTNDAQIPKSIGTTKGDLIAYTASGTPVRLPVGGVNGQILTVDSTQTTGMKWSSVATSANTLDFSEFKDAMTLDGATSIQMGGLALSIIDSGAGALTMTPGGALTLNAGAASSLSTDSGALTITAAATSTWGTNSGNLNLKAAGASSGNVQIGSGTASSTPDVLVLDVKNNDATDPTGTNGAMYYNSTVNKMRCYENGAWKDCDTASSVWNVVGTDISPAVSGNDLLLNAGETLTIGGGTAITNHLSVSTASLSFSVAKNTCGDLSSSVTVIGAAVGDTVVATPDNNGTGIGSVNGTWNAYVSAPNTVIIRVCNVDTSTIAGSNTWRVDVWKH